MWTRRAFFSAWFGCTLACAIGGCDVGSLFDVQGVRGAVYITAVDGLSSPAVPTADLYRPEFRFPIDPDNPAAGQAVGFFINVTAAEASRLRMRLLAGGGAAPLTLQRIPPPPESDTAGPVWQLPGAARDFLVGGEGVFWFAEPLQFDRNEYWLGVVLPDSWSSASVSLQVYAESTAAGDPLLSDRIELAREFFYMAGVGDSLMWGNGLPDAQKFFALVADEIQRRTGQRVIRTLHAISATLIEPLPGDVNCPLSCTGEVPTTTTSISTQVDRLEGPEQLDLVLVDGCINEVGVVNILLPETNDAALAAFTQHTCYGDMLALLQKVRATAPRATIVVTGYYPILSTESTLPDLLQVFIAQHVSTTVQGPELVKEAAAQSRIFLDASRSALTAAVDALNTQTGDSATLFVDPGFTDQNAMFASDPLLWGLTPDRRQGKAIEEGLTLFPEDPMADLRATSCFNTNVLVDPITCLYASVGHPNLRGAQRYAQVILAALEQHGDIPAPPP